MLLYRVCPGCRIAHRRAGKAVGSPAGRIGRRPARAAICPGCLGAATAAEPIDDLPDLDAALALYHYDDLVQRVVVAAKNGGRRDVVLELGLRLAASIDEHHVGPFDVVTWVPASSGGVRRRGYDQGRLLGRAVAGRLGVASRRLLLRRRGHAQAGRDRLQRISGPELRAPVRCPDRILLVDDVITTGASMSAAARALRRSGARSVVGLAVARATAPGHVPLPNDPPRRPVPAAGLRSL